MLKQYGWQIFLFWPIRNLSLNIWGSISWNKYFKDIDNEHVNRLSKYRYIKFQTFRMKQHQADERLVRNNKRIYMKADCVTGNTSLD